MIVTFANLKQTSVYLLKYIFPNQSRWLVSFSHKLGRFFFLPFWLPRPTYGLLTLLKTLCSLRILIVFLCENKITCSTFCIAYSINYTALYTTVGPVNVYKISEGHVNRLCSFFLFFFPQMSHILQLKSIP